MTTDKEKEYKFDEKLVSDNIKFIDRVVISSYTTKVRCDRHKGLLRRYVNTIRIDDKYYQIGDDCYKSIKNKLSEIRGKSLKLIKDDLEEDYIRYLEGKWLPGTLDLKDDKDTKKRFDPDYNKFKILEWDIKHGNPPDFKKKEYQELKQKFSKIKKEL